MIFMKRKIRNCGWLVWEWGIVRARIGRHTPDHPVLQNSSAMWLMLRVRFQLFLCTIGKGDSLGLLFGNKRGLEYFCLNEISNGLEPLTTHKYE